MPTSKDQVPTSKKATCAQATLEGSMVGLALAREGGREVMRESKEIRWALRKQQAYGSVCSNRTTSLGASVPSLRSHRCAHPFVKAAVVAC